MRLFFHQKRERARRHRMWVLLTGLLLLFVLTSIISLLFGMSRTALLVLFPLFAFFMLIMDLAIEHH
ncbi:hypothetical protein C0581_01300 [Candidatus Parcubacteria bacterium]|nr:MAG: hypothetical protein C0581_01300 [Candidatus Parcubacteria bacterium]